MIIDLLIVTTLGGRLLLPSSKKCGVVQPNKFMNKNEMLRYKVTLIYIAITFFALPLFFWNMYFNISQEKWMCFTILSLIYVFFILVSYILDNTYLIYFKKLIANLTVTEYAFFAFLIFSILSTIFSVNPFASFSGGVNARYNGCINIIIYAFVFFIARKHFYKGGFLINIFAATGAIVSITSICQYFTFDPIGMYNNVTVASLRRMISTIGNMNIYASYLSLSVAACLFCYVYAKKISLKIFWGLCLAIGFAGGLAGNSDSFYLGIGAAALIFICAGGLTLKSFGTLVSALCFACGADYIFLSARSFGVSKGLDIRPTAGVATYFSNNMSLLKITFVAALILFLLIKLLILIFGTKYDLGNKLLPGPVYIIVSILFITSIIGILGYVFSMYPFENEMGSYRGFIWNLSIDDFKNMSLFRKLFGYGPETIYSVYYSKYHTEMVNVTGVVYDNVHSEPLEYLMTSGILGAVSYLTLVISLLVRLCKKARHDSDAYMFLLPVFAYFTQSFVNIAQSATTPLYFLIIALAGGFLQPDKIDRLKAIDEYTEEDIQRLI
jgi:O-antigen ligase